MDNKKATTSGLTILDVLLIVFIVLKLCGLIDWPWVYVLIPFWIGLAIFFVALVVIVILWEKKKI